MIELSCPSCGFTGKADPKKIPARRKLKCPKCSANFALPIEHDPATRTAKKEASPKKEPAPEATVKTAPGTGPVEETSKKKRAKKGLEAPSPKPSPPPGARATGKIGGHSFKDVSFFNISHLRYLFLSTDGRINRKPFWYGTILLSIVNLIVVYGSILTTSVIAVTIGGPSIASVIPILFAIVIVLLLVYCSIVMNIKRSHDCNRSGSFVLLFLVPIVSLWPAITFAFIRGTEGENRFGPDPLG